MSNSFRYDISARRTSSDMATRKQTKKLESPKRNNMVPPVFNKSVTKGSQTLMMESKITSAVATNISSIIA